MMDISPTIVARSDQLNADDLIDRTITIKITRVDVKVDEQPVALSYEGDNGKPYKPGKSMRRVLAHAWGTDAAVYVGRSLTLYRDPSIQFGGLAVGGIRISHMTNILGTLTIALTQTRGSKKAFTVKPLKVDQPAPRQSQQQAGPAQVDAEAVFADAKKACEEGRVTWGQWWKGASPAERDAVKPRVAELQAILAAGEVDDDPLAERDGDGQEAA